MTAAVAQTIARSNRNRLIRSVIGIVAVIIFATVTYRYFYNFFLGPFPISREELLAASGPGDLFRYYVTVEGDGTRDTRFQMTERRNGVVTRTTNYAALLLGDRMLLVATPGIVISITSSYTGYLERPSSEIRNDVMDVFESRRGADGAFLPMQLTVGDFKFPGYLGLLAGAAVLGLSLWGLGTAVQRLGDNSSHPIMRALGRYGDPSLAVSSIDAELQADHPQIGSLHLTPTWLIDQKGGDLRAARHDDLVWVYKLVTKSRNGTSYSAQIWDRHGVLIAVQAREDLVNQMLGAVIQRAPWALAGHNAEIEKAWKSNRATVLAAVDQRRQQAAGSR